MNTATFVRVAKGALPVLSGAFGLAKRGYAAAERGFMGSFGEYPDHKPKTPANLTQEYVYNGQTHKAGLHLFPAKGDHPKGFVFYALGYGTHPDERKEQIADMQKSGLTVIVMPLVITDKSEDFMAQNKALYKTLVYDETSVLRQKIDIQPLAVITHSTSGLLHEDTVCDAIEQGLKGPEIVLTIHDAPILSHRYNETFHRYYSTGAKERHLGEPLRDKAMMALTGKSPDQLRAMVQSPRHGDIQEISDLGKRLFERVPLRKQDDTPTILIVSENDPVINPKTARKYGEKIGATVLESKTGHVAMNFRHMVAYAIKCIDTSIERHGAHRDNHPYQYASI